MIESETAVESILVADIGSVNTKVGLVDVVGSQYRIVATGASLTTLGANGSDVSKGVSHAIEQIQQRTHRPLLGGDGQLITPALPNGQGVDAFAGVTSAPPPLKVVIVGLSREVSVATAARAIRGTYATIETTIALDQMGGRWVRVEANGKSPAETEKDRLEDPSVIAAEALARSTPDVIIMVGGMDGGATTALYEIANLIAAIAAARDEDARPLVIFAGNREARSQVAARLGPVTVVRMVDNVHPTLDEENPHALSRELESLYEERITRLPGHAALAPWLRAPIAPTVRSFEHMIRYLAARYRVKVLGVDIGAATITLIGASREEHARIVRADLGVGMSARNVISQAGTERLLGWVPEMELSAEEAEARWLNRFAHPAQIPATREDLYLSQALAREALATAAHEAEFETADADLIVLSGGVFSRTAQPGGQALVALDALEPRRLATLAVDSFGLLPTLGALAGLNTQAAADVIERDGFVPLATVISATSFHREGKVDVNVKMRAPGTGEMSAEIEHGTLELLPVISGQSATLQVEPAPGVEVGREGNKVLKVDVTGGSLGLIVDARGRPLSLPATLSKRRAKVKEWLWDVGG